METMEKYTKHAEKHTLTGEIVFLLLALPMGIVFFSLTITCFVLGVGTLVIWLGLPILFATLYMVHGMATLERNMVRDLLHMPHPDQPYGRVPVKGFLRNLGSLLCDPYTWTSMVYMLFIKLPLGIISFTLTITFVALSFCLTCLPLVYLLNVFINSILIRNGVPSAQSILIPYFVEIHGSFDPLMFARSFVGIPLGLVFCFMTRSLIKGLTSFSGVLANAMLGPGATTDNTQPHTLNYVPPTHSTEQRAYYAVPTHMAEQQSYTE
jgi:hypothetical protein